MLTTQSFIIAVLSYGLAALVGLAMIRRLWVRRSASLASSVVMGLIGGLLLTPAYPRDGVDTLAPAFVVAGFQIATEGVESAQHALKPLNTLFIAQLFKAIICGQHIARNKQSTDD